jgi:hypothetical protein
MSKPNLYVNVFIVVYLVANLSVAIYGYMTNKFSFFISILNIIIGSISIIYFIANNLKISYLNIETREIIYLIFEVFVLFFALYYLINKDDKPWLNMLNYIGFGINFLAGFVMLLFMLIFKMNRLF